MFTLVVIASTYSLHLFAVLYIIRARNSLVGEAPPPSVHTTIDTSMDFHFKCGLRASMCIDAWLRRARLALIRVFISRPCRTLVCLPSSFSCQHLSMKQKSRLKKLKKKKIVRNEWWWILTACKPNQFECTPGYCISLDLRCDGFNHCSNGRDERDCSSNRTKQSTFNNLPVYYCYY